MPYLSHSFLYLSWRTASSTSRKKSRSLMGQRALYCLALRQDEAASLAGCHAGSPARRISEGAPATQVKGARPHPPWPRSRRPADRLTACHFGLFRDFGVVVRHRVGMLGRRKSARADIAREGFDRGFDPVAYLRVFLDEFRHAGREAEHVLEHEDLSVAFGRCADTDGRNVDQLGDARGEKLRERFENDRKG